MAPRRSARRSALVAAACIALLTAVAAREGFAKRHVAATTAELPAELAAALQAPRQSPPEELMQAALADALTAPQASNWVTIEVKRGQTLSDIFAAEGLGFSEAIAVVKLGSDAARLKALRPGDRLSMRKSPDDRLEELRFEFSETGTLHVRRGAEDQLEAVTLAAEIERRQMQVAGVIGNSLFLDGQRAGLSDRLLMQMADIFGYEIDFALDLRVGDRFAVVYEELYRGGDKLRDGDIVVAEFVNRGQRYRAVRYSDADGNVAYYTPEGESLRKAFLRTPVDFARVSSGFNPNRRHPILNTIRAHKGVDYAAATGTPIKATGAGRVEFIGVKGGYGRVVILKHGSQYTTLYAHLSRYRESLRIGSRVKQGQIIGYVGASGLATAPHLHYEFRINDVHKNPMTVSLPRAQSLPKPAIARWRTETAHALAQLDALSDSQVAQAQGAQARLNR